MKPTLVIMAAGMGSRYGGLKQIDALGPNSEIMLDYAVYDAIKTGFGKVVFIIRKDIEDVFKKVVGGRFNETIPVEYAYQELHQLPDGFTVPDGREKPWGTGHAMLACKDVVKEPFAVLNADDFYGRQSYTVLADRLSSLAPEEARGCLVGFTLQKTLSDHGPVARAICESHDGRHLSHIVERLAIEKCEEGAQFEESGQQIKLTGKEWVSMNMWGFTPAVFPMLEKAFSTFLEQSIEIPKSEFLIPSVVADLIDKGSLTVEILPSDAQWFGVTYTADKPSVLEGFKQMVEAGLYPSPIWS